MAVSVEARPREDGSSTHRGIKESNIFGEEMSTATHNTAMPFITRMPETVNIESIFGDFGPSGASFEEHFVKVARGLGVTREATTKANDSDITAILSNEGRHDSKRRESLILLIDLEKGFADDPC